MIEVTFDPEARSIYCYFTEIAEGDDAQEMEVPGALLLDAEGQIAGLRLELGDALGRQELRFALDQPGVSYDEAEGMLRVLFADMPIVEEQELAYDAILDLDKRRRVLGLEVITEAEFGIEGRLTHIEPYLVPLDEYEEQEEEEDKEEEEERGEPAHIATRAEAELDYVHIEPEVVEAVALPGEEQQIRSGFVALVGKPNVGKSTLLNAYLGQKVSIVSPKPQTTRIPVRGILNRPDAQVIFIDTPGIHEPRHKLGSFMVEVARRAIPNADVLCFMVDISEPPSRLDAQIAKIVKSARQPHILVLNKVDATKRADVHLQEYRALGPWDAEIAISATRGEGLDALLEMIIERLSFGPRYYPEDQVSDQSERELIAELIREKVLLNTQEEVPHGVAVEVEEWEEKERILYIRATISVEKRSHKRIIIGAQGTMLKKIGAAARFEIERVLGRQVFLDLWVKVREGWRQNPNDLRWLGYDVKRFKE